MNQHSLEAPQITAKQTYLRNQIPADKYEDFGQFCETIAGNVDIQNWDFQYVKELVEKFQKSEAEKERAQKKPGQHFHMYQTGNANQIKNLAEQIKKQQEKIQLNHDKTTKDNKPKHNQSFKLKEQKSALEVLDQIFQKQTPAQYETKKYDKSFFQSCKFWGVIDQSTAKDVQGNKNNQSPVVQTKNVAYSLPLESENFEKIFQTGFQLPEQKNISKEKTTPNREKINVKKSPQKPTFVEIAMEQQEPNKTKSIISEAKDRKKSPIKLISVKNLSKQKKIPYDGEVLIKQPFKSTVACFKSFQRHTLSSKNLKIEILEHQVISRRFLSSDYVMYHLKVTPASIVCKRNFQDFQKLRKHLQNVYPGVRLPYLQKLGWLQSELSPENIAKQKKYLSYFLDDVLSHNELHNSRILEDFLTLKDHKQIKRKFQQYDKIKKITSIQQLCILQGEVKIEISQANRQYNQLFSELMDKFKGYWASKQYILEEIDSMHVRMANSYRILSQIADNMAKQVKLFNSKVQMNQIQFLESSLQSFITYTNQNRRTNEKQAQYINQDVLPFIRYQKLNMTMLDPIMAKSSEFTKQYLRRKDNEKGSDNLQYLSERLKDYKTDILQQSKNITVLKYQCGYMNNLAPDQSYNYFKLLSNKMSKLLSDICYSKLDQLSKTINSFTSLVYS